MFLVIIPTIPKTIERRTNEKMIIFLSRNFSILTNRFFSEINIGCD